MIGTIALKIKQHEEYRIKYLNLSLLTFGLLGLYTVLFYFVFTQQSRLDFSSFYSASQALREGHNPYQVLLTDYLSTVKKLSANLNPPIVLCLFSPLSKLSYNLAVPLWSLLSFSVGLIGAGLAFHHAFTPAFFKKNWTYLYLMYLAFFPTIMNAGIAQLGSIVLFFILLGYHFYQKNNHYFAGILWGMIIAIKLFPGLLFVYALLEKRYRVLSVMLATFLIMCLIPWFLYGSIIYTQYFQMMSRVLWYGDSWNASIYGFLFRLLIDVHHPEKHFLITQILYAVLFGLIIMFYIKQQKTSNQTFALTLVVMLILSPFGWIYYFPILIFPLCLTATSTMNNSFQTAWFVCLFLINFPMDCHKMTRMSWLAEKLSFYSFQCYGLLLLAYLVYHLKNAEHRCATKPISVAPIFCILCFGVVIVSSSFWVKAFKIW